ncbi:hypothetical protein JCM10213_008974 [Rhodosporidiobolus nylandii]
MATPHGRTHSLASSTGSLSDDLAFASTPSYGDTSYSYGAPGVGIGDTSLSDIGDSPYLHGGRAGGSESRRSSVGLVGAAGGGGGERRSRARAFSFLSTRDPYGPREGDVGGPSPASGETPFVGGGYEYALDAEDDTLSDGEEGEAHEMRSTAAQASPNLAGGRAYRQRFQPLLGYELAWMGVSAAAVLGLTVGAVVLTWVG